MNGQVIKKFGDLQRYDMIDYDCFGQDSDGDFVDYDQAKELFEKLQQELRDKDALNVELQLELNRIYQGYNNKPLASAGL